MRRKTIFLAALISLGLIYVEDLFAQAPDTVWTRTFGGQENDVGRSICFAVDGGYIVTGYTESFGSPPRDAYLFKVDVDGNQVWQRTLGIDGYYYARCVKPTSDRGYIITGQAVDDGFFGNVFLLKTDSLGYVIWRRNYNGTHGVSVIENSEGKYVLVGGHLGYLADALMICVDSNGNQMWWRNYNIDLNEYAHDVVQVDDGGYIITGITGAGDLDSSWDLFIMKTNSTGETEWIKRYGNPDIYYDDIGYTIRRTTDGGFIIGATTCPRGDTYGDLWLVKTDAAGDTVWTRIFGELTQDYGYSAIQTLDGGYVIAGIMGSFWNGPDIFVAKTDADGNTLWTKTIGGDDSFIGTQVIETKSGELMIVGDTDANFNGGKDAYVIKLASRLTDIEDNRIKITPSSITMSQNYPNPFNSDTEIQLFLPESQRITLKVYDVMGREKVTIADSELDAGDHQFRFNASDLPSGIYFYQIEAAGVVETRRMVLLK